MSTTIKIGADELILTMRKNEYGKNISNEQLGRKIYKLIKELQGEKIKDDQQARWENKTEDKNIDRCNLPKTAAQYEIKTCELGALYDTLATW